MAHFDVINLLDTTSSALTMDAGETTKCFIIDWIPEGSLRRLVVSQIGGTASTSTTVNLYERNVCCAVEDDSNSSSSAAECAVAEAIKATARIIPTTTVATNIVELFNGAYPFSNKEGTYAVPVRRVYLEITHDSAAATTWEVSMCALAGRFQE